MSQLAMFPTTRSDAEPARVQRSAPVCACGRVALFTCNREHVCRACCADFLARLNDPKPKEAKHD